MTDLICFRWVSPRVLRTFIIVVACLATHCRVGSDKTDTPSSNARIAKHQSPVSPIKSGHYSSPRSGVIRLGSPLSALSASPVLKAGKMKPVNPRSRRWMMTDHDLDVAVGIPEVASHNEHVTPCRREAAITIGTPSSRPVTFITSASYLVTTFRPYSTFCMTFALRTAHPNGLILFSGDVTSASSFIAGSASDGSLGSDFMSVELFDGTLRYAFDLGGGARVLQHHLGTVSDNKWHVISISRPSVDEHRLQVDDHVTTTDDLPPSSTISQRSLYLNTGDQLFVGGVPAHAYNTLPAAVRSRDGFIGCLAELHLDESHSPVDLIGNPFGIPEQYRRQIRSGCPEWDVDGSAAGFRCTDEDSEACKHGGYCVTKSTKGVVCNCDMTSFTGPHCSDDSIAYTLNNRSGGLVTFSFPISLWPDTRRDQLSLGFRTTQSDGVLIRIVSGSSTDYIELELVDGSVLVVYNMGLANHPVGELFEKVNDGQYHRVVFYRDGPNATIQVDDLPVQAKFPTELNPLLFADIESSGQQLTTFNHQSKVFVGGRRDESTGRIHRAFHGTIAGLVFNGLRILDLAADRDDRVTIEGEVQLEVNPLFPSTKHVTSSTTTRLAPWHRPVTVPTDPSSKLFPAVNPVKPGRHPPTIHDVTTSQKPPLLLRPGSTPRLRHPAVTSRTKSVVTSSFGVTTPRHDNNDVRPCNDDDEDCDDSSGVDESSEIIDKSEVRNDVQTKRVPFGRPSDDLDIVNNSQFPTFPYVDIQRTTMASISPTSGMTQPFPLQPEVEENQDLSNGIDEDSGLEQEEDLDEQQLHEDLVTDDHEVDRRQHPSASTGFGVPSSQQFGTNLGLIVGIAAGIIVLMVILGYAVCRYRGCSRGRRGANGRKEFIACGTDVTSTSVATRSLTGTSLHGGGVGGGAHMFDHHSDTLGGRAGGCHPTLNSNTTTPLLRGDSSASNCTAVATSGYLPPPSLGGLSGSCDAPSQPLNGYGSDGRRKKKDVKEWYV